MVTPHQDPDHIHLSVLCSMMECSLVKLHVRARRVEKGERGEGRGGKGRKERVHSRGGKEGQDRTGEEKGGRRGEVMERDDGSGG